MMEPIRNERHEIVGYRDKVPGGRVNIRDKHGELAGWTYFDQTRKKNRTLVSSQENEGLLYRELD